MNERPSPEPERVAEEVLREVRLGDARGENDQLSRRLDGLRDKLDADAPGTGVPRLCDMKAALSSFVPADDGPGQAELERAVENFEAREARRRSAGASSLSGNEASPGISFPGASQAAGVEPVRSEAASPKSSGAGLSAVLLEKLLARGIDSLTERHENGYVQIIVAKTVNIHLGSGPFIQENNHMGDHKEFHSGGDLTNLETGGGDVMGINTGRSGRVATGDVTKQTVDQSVAVDVEITRVIKLAREQIAASTIDPDDKADASRALDRLEGELKKAEPDKSKLLRFWEAIRSVLPDVAKTLESAAKLGDLLKHALPPL